jgi:predicted amino acid racemase
VLDLLVIALSGVCAGDVITATRIGEAILLGRRDSPPTTLAPELIRMQPVLHAEALRLKTKRSVPIGERGEDAFGHVPVFVDRGEVRRAILNVGREDVVVEGMKPLDSDLEILGASSDCVIVDVTRSTRPLRIGDSLAFLLDYGALLAAMTSPYVEKRPVRRESLAASAS